MIPKTNRMKREKFALLSNYETTFVMYLEDESKPLWISEAIERENLSRAIFFVLALDMSLSIDLCHKYPFMFDYLTTDKYLEQLRPIDSYPSRPLRGIDCSKLVARPKLDLHEIFSTWLTNGRVIGGGSGRSGVVVSRVEMRDGKCWVLKMVDVFNHEPGALEQLENEYKALRFVKIKPTGF